MIRVGFKAIYHMLDTNAIKEIMENAGLPFKPHGKNLKGNKNQGAADAGQWSSQDQSVSVSDDNAHHHH